MGVLLIVAALALFAFGLYFSFREKPEIKAIFAAGALCLIFAFLREFKRFEAFGVKGELLDQKIGEADKTIGQLRSLSKPLSELMFTMVARSGRWDSMIPRRDRYRIMRELESELRQIGMSESEIEDAKRDWHRFNLIDLSWPIFKQISDRVKEEEEAQHKRIDALSRPSVSDHEAHKKEVERLWRISSEEKRLEETVSYENIESVYDAIMDFIRRTDIFTEAEKQDILATGKDELEDLEYYSKHKEFRRPEHWFESEQNM